MTAETAAALLGTSTTILGLWEKRFGYPERVRSADGQWLYAGVTALGAVPAVALGADGGHPNRPTTHTTRTNKLLKQQAGG